MKRILVIYFLLPLLSFGQKLSKENKTKLKEGNVFLKYKYYDHAYKVFNDLIKVDSSNSAIKFGYGVSQIMFAKKADIGIHYLESLNEEEYPRKLFYLGKAYHLKEDFFTAISFYESYAEVKSSNEDVFLEIRKSRRATRLIDESADFDIENLVDLNSKYSDYTPVVSEDGSTLFFTSKRENGIENIYTSEKNGEEWKNIEKLEKPINSETNDAIVNLSSSANTIILYRTHENKTGGNLLKSTIKDGIWSDPEPLINPINTDFQEASACITSNGNTIYFSSNRPGGFGGKDLYRITKLPDNNWSLPLNLGPKINSEFDEDAPFLSENQDKIYFSSNNAESIGGYDIFYSEIDVNMELSSPINVGSPINSVYDDIFFSLVENGTVGYFSSDRITGIGGLDLYRVKMPYDDFFIIGKSIVKAADSKQIETKITLIDEDLNKVVGKYVSNVFNGKFIMLLYPDKKYHVVIEANGYHSKTVHFNTDGIEENEIELNYELVKKI